jgi:hypothetical protein
MHGPVWPEGIGVKCIIDVHKMDGINPMPPGGENKILVFFRARHHGFGI